MHNLETVLSRLPRKAANNFIAEVIKSVTELEPVSEPHPEVARCAGDVEDFLRTYVQIYDATDKTWIPFDLWPEQARAVQTIHEHPLNILLKSRQLGLTWLVLGYALWLGLFHGAAAITLFSRRDTEAVYLLSTERLRGMYARLPEFLQVATPIKSNDHEWELSNGSIVRAFPTTA